MNETNCESLLMAKMAELDGEAAEISADQINSHLAICKHCRTEFERMKSLHFRLQSQSRREQTADLWTAIEPRIGAPVQSQIGVKPFLLCGLMLVVCKLLEMLPARDFGLIFKIVPLIFVIALFVFVKVNPFKINARLAPEN